MLFYYGVRFPIKTDICEHSEALTSKRQKACSVHGGYTGGPLKFQRTDHPILAPKANPSVRPTQKVSRKNVHVSQSLNPHR